MEWLGYVVASMLAAWGAFLVAFPAREKHDD